PITSRSSLRIDPVKFPSMRSMPLKCSSPFRFIPLSKNPEMPSEGLVSVFINLVNSTSPTVTQRHEKSIDKVAGLRSSRGGCLGNRCTGPQRFSNGNALANGLTGGANENDGL